MWRWCAAVSLLAACVGLFEKGHGTINLPAASTVMVGHAFPVETSWHGTCRKRVCTKGGYHDSPIRDEECSYASVDCEDSPYDVHVHCTGPSAGECPPPKHVERGAYNFDITPLHAGPLRIEITLVHGGERMSQQEAWDVHDPDDLQVKSPVSAELPYVALRTSFRGVFSSTTAMHVNGRPVTVGFVDLSVLFPDRHVGRAHAVMPGTYELTVDVGGFHRVISVEAIAGGAAPGRP
jgi:hypothetical protein